MKLKLIFCPNAFKLKHKERVVAAAALYPLHQTKQHPDIAVGQIHSPMVCESSQQIGTVQERKQFMASSDHFNFYLTLYESLLLVPSPKIH